MATRKREETSLASDAPTEPPEREIDEDAPKNANPKVPQAQVKASKAGRPEATATLLSGEIDPRTGLDAAYLAYPIHLLVVSMAVDVLPFKEAAKDFRIPCKGSFLKCIEADDQLHERLQLLHFQQLSDNVVSHKVSYERLSEALCGRISVALLQRRQPQDQGDNTMPPSSPPLPHQGVMRPSTRATKNLYHIAFELAKACQDFAFDLTTLESLNDNEVACIERAFGGTVTPAERPFLHHFNLEFSKSEVELVEDKGAKYRRVSRSLYLPDSKHRGQLEKVLANSFGFTHGRDDSPIVLYNCFCTPLEMVIYSHLREEQNVQPASARKQFTQSCKHLDSAAKRAADVLTQAGKHFVLVCYAAYNTRDPATFVYHANLPTQTDHSSGRSKKLYFHVRSSFSINAYSINAYIIPLLYFGILGGRGGGY